jgi:hypothetical protein
MLIIDLRRGAVVEKPRKLIFLFDVAVVTSSETPVFMKGYLIAKPGRGEFIVGAAERWYAAKLQEMKIDPIGVHIAAHYASLGDIGNLPVLIDGADDIAAFLLDADCAGSILAEIQYLEAEMKNFRP